MNLLRTSYLTIWENICKRGDVCTDTLKYFVIMDAKFTRFYLPKIHKRLYNVPGRPGISNCGYYTENVMFLPFYIFFYIIYIYIYIYIYKWIHTYIN